MSYCDCDYDSDDPPRFCTVEVVKAARKAHKCSECGGTILPGESYKRSSGSWDRGKVDTYRECGLCLELREWAEISLPCFCCNIFGELHTYVQEMVKDVAPTTPGFFMEYGRRMIAIRRRRDSRQS